MPEREITIEELRLVRVAEAQIDRLTNREFAHVKASQHDREAYEATLDALIAVARPAHAAGNLWVNFRSVRPEPAEGLSLPSDMRVTILPGPGDEWRAADGSCRRFKIIPESPCAPTSPGADAGAAASPASCSEALGQQEPPAGGGLPITKPGDVERVTLQRGTEVTISFTRQSAACSVFEHFKAQIRRSSPETGDTTGGGLSITGGLLTFEGLHDALVACHRDLTEGHFQPSPICWADDVTRYIIRHAERLGESAFIRVDSGVEVAA